MSATLHRAKRRAVILGALLGLCLGFSPGCDSEYEPRWNQRLDVAGPYKVGDDLIYVNRTMRQLLRLDAKRTDAGPALELERAQTGAQPGQALVGVDGQSLFLLDEQDRTLRIYDLSQDKISVKQVKLQSDYDKIWLDPHGEFVILGFSGVERSDVIARSLNEVAIIKLAGADALAPSYVTLSSRADELVFAAPFDLQGQSQRLVAAMSDAEITILDLLADNEADQAREIPLTLSEAELPPKPLQAIFDVAPGEDAGVAASLYVLTDNGQDITQINIQPSARTGALKLDLSVNQLAAGSNPAAMALLDLGEQGHRLMVLERSEARFSLIDTISGEGSSFTLPMDRAATKLMVYSATVQVDGQVRSEPRVLAYAEGSPLVSIVRPGQIALSGDTPTQGRSVEAVRLEANPSLISMDQGQAPERAVVFHPGLKGGFTVLNLRTNRDIRIQGYSLESLTFSGAYAYGTFQGADYMGVFDLTTGHPTVFELPRQGKHIALDEEEGLIVVQHNDLEGSFTVFDADRPTPEHAVIVRDMFIRDLFDQEIGR